VPPAKPFFSVVVPTYDRPAELANCLAGLSAQDYPRDRFEIVVVDDGGSAGSAPEPDEHRGDPPIAVIRQAHAGQSAARNTGASVARGDYLAFTDDDCIPARDWLSALARIAAVAPAAVVGGCTLNALPRNPFSTASQVIVDVVYGYYNADPDNARFFATNNIAVPAEAFAAMGGFDVTFRTSEDRDFCDRWLSTGRRMVYAPDARVVHAHVLSFQTFCRQHFDYGRGAFRYHRARALRRSGRLRQDLGFYLRLPALFAAGVASLRASETARVACLTPVWQVVNAAGFAWEGARSLVGASSALAAPVALRRTDTSRSGSARTHTS
jgi:GT2 family glycosyltransferase